MKKTKMALLHSVVALVLCFSMFAGTTFAWFTDTVHSGINTIVAGNLDVEVYYGDPAEKNSIEEVDQLFKDVTLWEPGAVAYENLTVTNLGTLALKYQLSIAFGGENYVMEDGVATCGLSDILKIAVVEDGVDETLTREQLVASIPESDWATIDNFTFEGELLENTGADVFGIVIWWEPSEEDDQWNLNNGKTTSDNKDFLHIDLGVTVAATQYTYEEDSFDKNYDLNAAFPEIPSKWLAEDETVEWPTEGAQVNKGAITVIVPKGAPAGEYALDVDKFQKTVDKDDHAVIDMEFTLTLDGEPVAPGSALYTVIIAGDTMSEGHKITHNGEPVEKFKYDIFYNGIMFTTTSFSPFTVEYDIFGTAVELDAENRTIKSGLFTELDSANPDSYNPLKLDPMLDSTEAESIAVSYDVDGVKHYAVSNQATTVFVGDADDGGVTADFLTFLNGTAEVKMINNGKLYSLISGLENVAHSTVYLLPGTYNEATTIGVYSSMDIIGLGAADEIKVVKQSASSSNRHLFNCNGTKEDYIEVTLRNMTLDATAKTTNKKDNAAVQSIRKSKVKCYDLTIVKGTGWDAVAFYVNGNNEVEGVKYPAYLYVEHCSLNTTRTFGVVSTAGGYKFYHTGLTYGKNTAYTNNSGSIKNQAMVWDDWEW